jgi:hypothetical protein
MSFSTNDGSKKIQKERIADLVHPGKIYSLQIERSIGCNLPQEDGIEMEYNALFFYQLILPIFDHTMPGIEGDTKMGYYEYVQGTQTCMHLE